MTQKAKSAFVKPVLVFLLKFSLAVSVLLGAYLIYLDAKVGKQFEGQKWRLPVQVYARPFALEPDARISKQHLVNTLTLLGYRRTNIARYPGEFEVGSRAVRLIRRPFTFVDGPEPAQDVRVGFGRYGIDYLETGKTGEGLAFLRLDPLQIGRLTLNYSEDRELLPLQEIPESLIDTLLLVEDRDYYHHHGVSPMAILRALVTNIKAGRTVQGGSTLTQQLVKNMFLTSERTLWRKLNEALISLVLDYRYSKDQLLEAYLNEIYLGQQGPRGIHGFGLASRFYFAKPVNELAPHEYATLVGLIKGPSFYNPRRHPERALKRRDLILRLMLENNLLDSVAYEREVAQPLGLRTQGRESKERYPAYLDLVRRELRDLLSDKAYEQGIRVFTGLDPVLQEDMESAVTKVMPGLDKRSGGKPLENAMVAVDIDTARVTAMVGARKMKYRGFNRALDAKRQVGSVIKPAVYLAALEQYDRFTLASRLKDEPLSMKTGAAKRWSPKNYDKKYRGEVALIDALTNSYNIPTVNLGLKVGVGAVVDMAEALGAPRDRLPELPAVMLGAADMSPFEVSQFYHTLANDGQYRPLHAVTHITDAQGQLLYVFNAEEKIRVSPQAAYLVNYALHQVTREGTSKALAKIFPKVNFAGKTGTTNDKRDSWFVGYDSQMLVASWVGRDDNSPTRLTGASGALKLFIELERNLEPKSRNNLPPSGVAQTAFSQDTGLPLRGDCAQTRDLPAIARGLPQAQVCESEGFFQRLFGSSSDSDAR